MSQRIEDLRSIEAALANQLSRVRAEKSHLKRKEVDAGLRERAVSDHAVIRYLERCKGIDMDAVRDEIRAIADASEPFLKCDGHWHESGVVLILGEGGQVITVLSHEQAEKYGPRRKRPTPSQPSQERT